MDVRDYFAGQALKGLMKDGQEYKKEKSIQKLAFLAYQIADALLEARERPSVLPSLPEVIAPNTALPSQDSKGSNKSKSRKIQPSAGTDSA